MCLKTSEPEISYCVIFCIKRVVLYCPHNFYLSHIETWVLKALKTHAGLNMPDFPPVLSDAAKKLW